MRFYWLKCRQQQKKFDVYWDNGKNDFADYFTKHHSPSQHKAVRPIYLFNQNNKLDIRGCIKILNNRGSPSSKSKPRQTLISNKNTLLMQIE